MTEHSEIAEVGQSPDRGMFRRSSNDEVDVDQRLSSSSGSSDVQVTSEARIQNSDIGDDNYIETECERLNKYPDYCRTITIRGLTVLKHVPCQPWITRKQ